MFAKTLFDNLLQKKDLNKDLTITRIDSPKLTQERKSKDFDTTLVRSPVHGRRLRKQTSVSYGEDITPEAFMKRYTVEKEDFAKGAYGKVSLATDRITKQKVVIKKCQKSSPIKMIQTEVRAGQLIGVHPNIATFHRYQDFDDHHAMIFQYVDGTDLFSFLEDREFAPLTEDAAKAMLRDIFSGLLHCHSKNIAHRDIKLENILLDKSGKAFLIDFGLSGFAEEKKLFRDWVGSDNYIAPELVRRQSYDGFRADVFSCGVVAFALLFGVFPFDNLRVNGRHSNDPSKPLPALRVRFPTDVNVSKIAKELVLAMLEDDSTRRITVQEILDHPWMQTPSSPALSKMSCE